MSLTVHLPRSDLPFQHLSVKQRASPFSVNLQSAEDGQEQKREKNTFEKDKSISLEPGLQTPGQSADMVHTRGRKSPEPSDPDLTEPET